MSYYLDIFRSLQAHGVRYLVVGGLAVNLHGVPRVTHDLDLVLSLDKENVAKAVQAMTEVGFKPKLPVNPHDISNPQILNEWINEKHMKAFSFIDARRGFHVVDFIILSPLSFDEAYERRNIRSFEGTDVSVVSIDDLIWMKRKAGRDIDISDVTLLERARRFLEES